MDEKHETDDVLDKECGDEGPSAPPTEMLDPVAGYEGIPADGGGGKTVPLPPKLINSPREDQPSPLPPEARIPALTEDMAREALIKFVSSKWFYGSKPAKELTFRDLKPLTTYRYRLETFTEARSTEWTFVPYTDQMVDGPENGLPPAPWDVMVEPPPLFQNDQKKVAVPHTSSVKPCHKCHGKGRYRCSRCSGSGKLRCVSCNGTGQTAQKRCFQCSGTGRRRCRTCNGRGSIICSICKGKRNLLHYIQLTVTWKNVVFEHVPDHQTGFPVELFKKVKGDDIFMDEHITVYPMVGFPELEICEASKRGITDHNAQFSSTARILKQRQTIEIVPLTEVHCEYKQKTYSYYVYGTEQEVYAPSYPAKYFWGCNIF
ncbi:protein SSUH2 homolog isoform X1 [Protopterus annectens]|uniref:protein SSUH2 homolog isoform X1 n=1 Tax=Protopterus annectens TaxID=7888 RepID=UPI001CFB6953|nr:protein SSUH2 homolog isoform X1 [Protopterus annectens]